MANPEVRWTMAAKNGEAVQQVIYDILDRGSKTYSGILADGATVHLGADGVGSLVAPVMVPISKADADRIMDAMSGRSAER